VVTNGYGKPADIPGYFVGGKTGTAEKTGAHGYKKHTNISAFMSVFPMNAPRYAVYFMLDEPHGNASTGGFSTAGAVSAPAAGRVIAKIAPMLGLLPDTQNIAAIDQQLAIPLQPPRGYDPHSAAPATGPDSVPDGVPSVLPDSGPVAAGPAPRGRPRSIPASTPPIMRSPDQMRHEASLVTSVAAR